jgi:hypothetical protein
MLVNFKTVKGESFQLELAPSDTVCLFFLMTVVS